MRQEKPDPEAPPLFRTRQSFAAKAQEQVQHMHHVREVLDTRLATTKRGSVKVVDEEVPNFMEDAGMVSFTAEAVALKEQRVGRQASAVGRVDSMRSAKSGVSRVGEMTSTKTSISHVHPALTRGLSRSALSASPSVNSFSRRDRRELTRGYSQEELTSMGGTRSMVAAAPSLRRTASDLEELPPEPPDNLDVSQFSTLNRPNILELLDT